MKLIINIDILEKENLSLEEFAVLLYFKQTRKVLDDDIANSLWNKGYLIKDIDCYRFNSITWNKLCRIATSRRLPEDKLLRELAIQLIQLFPEGKILNGPYFYRSSIKDTVQVLRLFHSNYKDSNKNYYTDKDIIEATKEYVKSFDDDISRMVSLKNFIFRCDYNNSSTSSLLASYLENMYGT